MPGTGYEEGMTRCTVCGERKLDTEFYRARGRIVARCKPCVPIYRRRLAERKQRASATDLGSRR